MFHHGLCFKVNSQLLPEVGRETEVVARHRILFKVGARIKAVVDGPSVFRLGTNSPVNIAMLEPDPSQGSGSIDTVFQYEKVEFGIELDSLSESFIDHFLDSIPHPDSISLNPFDPEDIDVTAHLWHYDGNNWTEKGVSPRMRPGSTTGTCSATNSSSRSHRSTHGQPERHLQRTPWQRRDSSSTRAAARPTRWSLDISAAAG